MSETKITKKDLQEAKAPDAVYENASSVFDWILDHRNAVIGGVAAIVLVTLAVQLTKQQNEKALAERGGKLAAAIELSSRVVVEADKPSEDPENKTFHSYDAKYKAVTEALQKIIADYPNTETARAASLRLAVAELDAGKADEAIKGLETYLASGEKGLAILATESLGFAYEKKGDMTKAGEQFAKLTDLGAPGRAAFHKARLLELAGKKDEARTAYEAVTKDFEKEPVAGEAKNRIELLSLAPADQPGFTEPVAPPEPAKAEKKPAKKKGKKSKGT